MGLGNLFGIKKANAAPAKPVAQKAAAPKAAPAKKAASAQEKPKSGGGAKTSGTYNAAVCGDGISSANFEKLSAKSSGKTVDEWRKAVIESLEKAAKGDTRGWTRNDKGKLVPVPLSQDQANELHDVAKALGGKTEGTAAWTSTDQLQGLLDGKVKGLEGFAGNGAGYREHKRPMWGYLKNKGLAYEADWQAETSVSWVNAAGKRNYADASEIPYFVVPTSDTRALGTYAKITANGKSVYARLLEKGPALGEVSLKVWEGLGYTNVTPNSAPTSKVDITVFEGSGGLNTKAEEGYLNYDEIQRAGKLIEEGKAQSIRTRKELEEAEKKAGIVQPAPQQQAGLRLEHGFPTVAIGSDLRRVGYACEECTHEGGGYVIEGSSSVYVGKYPFARIADATNDGLGVVSGAETVFIGGTPTTATLA